MRRRRLTEKVLRRECLLWGSLDIVEVAEWKANVPLILPLPGHRTPPDELMMLHCPEEWPERVDPSGQIAKRGVTPRFLRDRVRFGTDADWFFLGFPDGGDLLPEDRLRAMAEAPSVLFAAGRVPHTMVLFRMPATAAKAPESVLADTRRQFQRPFAFLPTRDAGRIPLSKDLPQIGPATPPMNPGILGIAEYAERYAHPLFFPAVPMGVQRVLVSQMLHHAVNTFREYLLVPGFRPKRVVLGWRERMLRSLEWFYADRPLLLRHVHAMTERFEREGWQVATKPNDLPIIQFYTRCCDNSVSIFDKRGKPRRTRQSLFPVLDKRLKRKAPDDPWPSPESDTWQERAPTIPATMC